MGRSTTAQRSFVAPQDRHAGGTWIGLNDAGVFIGLTNRPAAASEDTGVSAHGTRSRGLLVRDLLRLEGVAAVRKALAGARGAGDPGEVGYRPFHLVACDEHDALRATLAEGADRPEIRELPPGVHVVCNRDGSDPGSRKVSWIERAVGSIDLAAPWREVRAGLIDVLRSHPFGHDSLESPCVHGEGYGTRSSTLLACSDDLCQAWHAEGAPCVTPYENYTHLLESLQSARV